MREKPWVVGFSIFICCLLVPVSTTQNIEQMKTEEKSSKPDFQFPSPMMDVPVWNANENWGYTMYRKTDYVGGDWQEMFANMTVEVLGNETYNLNGTNYNCYHLKNTMKITGRAQMYGAPVYIDGSNSNAPNSSVPAIFTEHQYARVSDLGGVYSEFYQHMFVHIYYSGTWMKIEIKSLTHNYSTPVAEESDFPIFVGDQWFLNRIDHTYGWEEVLGMGPPQNTSFIDQRNTSLTADCTAYENAGLITFPGMYGFKVEYSDNINTLNKRTTWANSTVKNMIKIHEYSNEGGNIANTWTNLTDYKLVTHAWETTIFINPVAQNVTENVIISGNIKPPASQDVVIEILDTPYKWVVVTTPGGAFSQQIPVPLLMDFTPTNYDLGSVGVIAHPVNEPMRYNVTTLTVLSKGGILLYTLSPGWNFVSVPLIPYDTSTSWVLGSLSYLYDHAEYYDMTDNASHWKIFDPDKPDYMNALKNINNSIGFWVHVTFPADVKLVVSGTQPATTTIYLKQGWNMIGYPSNVTRTVSQFKSEIVGGACTAVYGFNNIATYRISNLPDTWTMKAGQAYWVYVDADSTWTVSYN